MSRTLIVITQVQSKHAWNLKPGVGSSDLDLYHQWYLTSLSSSMYVYISFLRIYNATGAIITLVVPQWIPLGNHNLALKVMIHQCESEVQPALMEREVCEGGREIEREDNWEELPLKSPAGSLLVSSAMEFSCPSLIHAAMPCLPYPHSWCTDVPSAHQGTADHMQV